jgi:anti-sigma regulatory factor (Ser/Thr protein kinase)
VAEAFTARFDLPADSRAPGRARRLVSDVLSTWGRAEDSEIAQLLVSEVVTNAVRHVPHGRALEVRVTADATSIKIAVGDDSVLRPVMRVSGDDDESGRGMHLVAALATQWGVADDGPFGRRDGKQVWFELTAPSDDARPTAPTPTGVCPG